MINRIDPQVKIEIKEDACKCSFTVLNCLSNVINDLAVIRFSYPPPPPIFWTLNDIISVMRLHNNVVSLVCLLFPHELLHSLLSM